jgi:pimeloyl-ACP methyl ester carboxylesterase
LLGALGLVELPPRIDDYPPETRNSARASAYRNTYCGTLRREILAFEQSAAQASRVELPRMLPIVSLSGLANKADGPPPHVDLDRRLAELSERGEHWISKRAGHYPQLDQPAWVVTAIEQVVRSARSNDHPTSASSSIRQY